MPQSDLRWAIFERHQRDGDPRLGGWQVVCIERETPLAFFNASNTRFYRRDLVARFPSSVAAYAFKEQAIKVWETHTDIVRRNNDAIEQALIPLRRAVDEAMSARREAMEAIIDRAKRQHERAA